MGGDADGDEKIRGSVVLEEQDVERGMSEGSGSGKPLFLLVPLLSLVFLQVLVGHWTSDGAAQAWSKTLPILILIPLAWGGTIYARKKAARRILHNKTGTRSLDIGSTPRATPLVTRLERTLWGALYRYDEGASAFLFFINPTVKIIVPKRAFREDDLPRIREILRTCVRQRHVTNATMKTLVLWVVLVVGFLVVWQFMGKPADGAGDPSARRRADPRWGVLIGSAMAPRRFSCSGVG